MTRLLVTINGEPASIWQGFKEVCGVYGLPYNTLKGKPFPRKHGDIVVHRLPFRSRYDFTYWEHP